MRILLTFAALLFFTTVPVYSADGQIPNSSLARLGLAGMTSMSDAQGLEIRGLGVMEAMGGNDDNQMRNDEHNKDDHNKKDHNKKDHNKKEKDHKHHEHEHNRHEHNQNHHEHDQNHFKCDFHMKPTFNFSSLCHTRGGKAG